MLKSHSRQRSRHPFDFPFDPCSSLIDRIAIPHPYHRRTRSNQEQPELTGGRNACPQLCASSSISIRSLIPRAEQLGKKARYEYVGPFIRDKNRYS